MIIVSNATPLIAFSKIQQLNLLKSVVNEIIIPEEIFNEVVIYGQGKPGSLDVQKASWIKSQKVSNQNQVNLLLPTLDKGEAEVIVLAQELQANLVLIDEVSARKVAKLLNLTVIGTIGILIKAKDAGHIHAVKPYFDQLINSGLRYNLAFYNKVLSQLNEI